MGYFENDRGDVCYELPDGVQPPTAAQIQSVQKPTFFGGEKVPLRNTKPSKFAGGMKMVDRKNSALPKANLGQKRGTVLKALYSHLARFEDELTIRKGDLMIGIEKVEGGAWWMAELNGKRGHVPGNYVEIVQAPPTPGRKPSKFLNTNYGASTIGWFQGQEEKAPKRPEKPEIIKKTQVRRDPKQMLRDQKETTGGNPLVWTFLCHTWGYAFAICAIVSGVFALSWYQRARGLPIASNERRLLGTETYWSGPATLLAGFVALVFEYLFGLEKSRSFYNLIFGLPYRTLLYACLSVPCFFSFVTIFAGIVGVATMLLNAYAEYSGERGGGGRPNFLPRYNFRKVADFSPSEFAFFVGLLVVLFLGFLARFVYIEFQRQDCLRFVGEDRCPTLFGSLAKGFGTQLDILFAIIFFPVLRASIARFSKIRVGKNKTMANVVPIQKSLAFHKVMGYLAVIAVIGHIVFHLLNYASNAEFALELFGKPAFWSGGGILLASVILFAGAHSTVRKGKYEAFWWSHHVFLIMIPLLLTHGPKFWYGAVLFVPWYFVDRTVRARRGAQNVFYVDYIRYIHPVLEVRFFPERPDIFRFQAGQFLYLNVPYISWHEWHPFTMSSSEGDLEAEGYISLHIRIQRPGSWTWKVKEYFKLLAGAGNLQPVDGVEPGWEESFQHFDGAGVVRRGKRIGVDGNLLIRVDGPQASQVQVYGSYEEIMLVGSGIGLTPSAAVLSSVTRYKWKKGFSPETLRFYWVVRWTELDSFDWFIDLLMQIELRVNSDRRNNMLTGHHRLEINVYVTSVPSNPSGKSHKSLRKSMKTSNALRLADLRKAVSSTQQAGHMNADLGFTFDELQTLLMNPEVQSVEQAALQLDENRRSFRNKRGDIWIWKGRPDWPQIFDLTKSQRRAGVRVIGVPQCGSRVIGKDIKKQCEIASGPDVEFVAISDSL